MNLGVILAFDYGSRRVGVATIGGNFDSPTAQVVIGNTPGLQVEIKDLITKYKPRKLLVGLPHNLDGEETDQSKLCREFAKDLERYKLPVILYDETLSSERAKERLGKVSRKIRHQQLDALAAQIILEDYLSHGKK